MRLLKALSLLAALALLGGAVLDAQTGAIRQALGAAPDAGKGKTTPPGAANSDPVIDDNFISTSKAGPLIRHRNPPAPQAQQAANPAQQSPAQQAPTQAAVEPKKDAGK